MSVRLMVGLLALHLFSAPSLWASCGSTSCPIDSTSQSSPEVGMVQVNYSYEYIDQDRLRISRRRATVGEIRGHHDEVSTLNEIKRIGVQVGLTKRFSVICSLPFIRREHHHVHNHHGSPLQEHWNVSGMGDLTLLGKYDAMEGGSERKPTVSVLLGALLPTGRDQAVNADGAEAETGILPGKGAYGLIVGAGFSRLFKGKTMNGLYVRNPLFISSTYQWNGKGKEDYKIGNTWVINAGFTYPLLPKLGWINQINVLVNRRDDSGNTREEIQKTGGTYVYASPGLQVMVAENLWTYGIVQIPVYQRVNQIQLTFDYNFIGGFSYQFSLL